MEIIGQKLAADIYLFTIDILQSHLSPGISVQEGNKADSHRPQGYIFGNQKIFKAQKQGTFVNQVIFGRIFIWIWFL